MNARVRCWKLGYTDKAILVTTVPPERHPSKDDAVWVPKSQIEHISTMGPTKEGEPPVVVLHMQEWIAEKKKLL